MLQTIEETGLLPDPACALTRGCVACWWAAGCSWVAVVLVCREVAKQEWLLSVLVCLGRNSAANPIHGCHAALRLVVWDPTLGLQHCCMWCCLCGLVRHPVCPWNLG